MFSIEFSSPLQDCLVRLKKPLNCLNGLQVFAHPDGLLSGGVRILLSDHDFGQMFAHPLYLQAFILQSPDLALL